MSGIAIQKVKQFLANSLPKSRLPPQSGKFSFSQRKLRLNEMILVVGGWIKPGDFEFRAVFCGIDSDLAGGGQCEILQVI